MSHHQRVIRGAALIGLVAVVMFWSVDRAFAQVSPGTVELGPIGVAKNEAVRINVYGISDPNDVPWEFTIRIYNRRGQLASERRLQLAGGVTGSVDVNIGNPDLFPLETLGRRTLRAVIVGFNPQPDPPGKFAATFETYNVRTGVTGTLLRGEDILIGDAENLIPRR